MTKVLYKKIELMTIENGSLNLQRNEGEYLKFIEQVYDTVYWLWEKKVYWRISTKQKKYKSVITQYLIDKKRRKEKAFDDFDILISLQLTKHTMAQSYLLGKPCNLLNLQSYAICKTFCPDFIFPFMFRQHFESIHNFIHHVCSRSPYGCLLGIWLLPH